MQVKVQHSDLYYVQTATFGANLLALNMTTAESAARSQQRKQHYSHYREAECWCHVSATQWTARDA